MMPIDTWPANLSLSRIPDITMNPNASWMGPHWMSHKPHYRDTKTVHHLNNSKNKVLLLLLLHPDFSKGLTVTHWAASKKRGHHL